MTWYQHIENGAKYIIVFDSNKNWTENVLQQDQFDAMKQFWQYTQENPRTGIPVATDQCMFFQRTMVKVSVVQTIQSGGCGMQIITLLEDHGILHPTLE